MPVDAFLVLVDQNNQLLTSESTVNVDFTDPFRGLKGPGSVFELKDFSFDVEQTLNIGSQSTGVGAGRVTFNPFSITRRVDKVSAQLFQMCCQGATFQGVDLLLRRSGATGAGSLVAAFGFKLVAIKTIAWTPTDDGVDEVVTFEFGSLQVSYPKPGTSGSTWDTKGWDRVKNVATPPL